MKRAPIRIFGILASAAFALCVVAGFLPWLARIVDWRRAFSYVLMSRLFGSVVDLLLLMAFVFLLYAPKCRRSAILGIAGTVCSICGKVLGWALWLDHGRLLEAAQMSLIVMLKILFAVGWFFLFLATVRLREMCRWARICTLVGLGEKILFQTAWIVCGVAYNFCKHVQFEQVFNWLGADVLRWIDLSFFILPLVAFFSLALGQLRPQGERVIFAFEGRARRKEYWMWLLWCTLFVNVVLAIPVYSILFIKCPTESRVAALWLWWITSGVVMGLLTLPVRVRRLHDRNLSGWWLLLFDIGMLIPVVNVFAGIAYFVIVGCLDGTVGPNDYGDDPKGRKAVASAPVSNATPVAAQGILGTPEDRLVKIRELYEKGLLTEAEYNLKRAAIISEV